MNDVKSYNTIKDLIPYTNYSLLKQKVQMLNKPDIHYIDVKIMNNISRKPLD